MAVEAGTGAARAAAALDPSVVEAMPTPAALAVWPGPRVAAASPSFPARAGQALHEALPEIDPALLEGVRRSGRPERLSGLPLPEGRWDATLIPVAHEGSPAVLVLLAEAERLARAEEAARRLDALMRHLPEGVIIADGPEVSIRRISDYGIAMACRPRAEIESSTAERHVRDWNVFRADGTPAAEEDLPLTRAIRRGEQVIDAELLIERPDGTRVPILCNAGPVLDETGAVTGGVVAWRDIGALRRAEGDLRGSELRHRLALAAAGMGDLELDLDTGQVRRSPLLDRLFGLEAGPGPLLSRQLLERVHAEDAPALGAALDAARAERQPIEVEFRVARPDGGATWAALRGEVLDGADGRPSRLIGVVADVTRRKLQERALELALREKEEALARSHELFGQVHHRVKNSLQLVASLLNLQGRMLGDPSETQFAEANRRVLTVAQVHERLYRTGRISSVEFGEFLGGLCRDTERAAMVGGRDCAIAVEATTGVELPTERVVPLALIVNELLGNALAHAYPDGAAAEMRVAFAALDEGRHRLSVEDRGVGLPEGFDAARSRSLGMKLVQALARQVEGRLAIERLAPGTRFTVEF